MILWAPPCRLAERVNRHPKETISDTSQLYSADLRDTQVYDSDSNRFIGQPNCFQKGSIELKRHTIKLFMWGYQPHYRVSLEIATERVFEELGVEVHPRVLLVGALDTRKQDRRDRNPVCIEPEDGEWPLTIFVDLLNSIETIVQEHPLQNVFYSDELSMRDKPEKIRQDSVTRAVRQAFLPYDSEHSVRSFCGIACPVDAYYVVPVIQVPQLVFQQFPPLKETEPTDYRTPPSYPSMIHACMDTVLAEAAEELRRPDPGRHLMHGMRQADEIVRRSAVKFMHTPGCSTSSSYMYPDLFERFNFISSLMYEGTQGTGLLFLVAPENDVVDYQIRFKKPVPFREPRWARKILQMASGDIGLIADSEQIYGLGKLQTDHDPLARDVFTLRFLDHYHWELLSRGQVLLRSYYGKPTLPRELISRERFISNYARLFPEASSDDHIRLWDLFKAAVHLKHGSMIVVAADASTEAYRLMQQGTNIEPELMTVELLRLVSNIDGTIVLDPHGTCHAVGVILDGEATSECMPSRGSRFNSGLRYVSARDTRRLAIVVSDDQTVDIIPLLRPQINRDDIEANISFLESATLEDYHNPREWLDSHRFYLNGDQCDRVNLALDRIEQLPKDVDELVILTNRFKPDPLMDDSYFLT